MVKHTSLTSAKSVVGTCPDMCPEKERYRREDTRRLSWFEVDHSTYEPGVSYVVYIENSCWSSCWCFHFITECESRSSEGYQRIQRFCS